MIEHAFRIGHHLTPAQEAEVGRAMLAASERDDTLPRPWSSDFMPVEAMDRAAKRRKQVASLCETSTFQEMADALGVSLRTIYEDLAWLRANGRLPAAAKRTTAQLNDDERAAMLAKANRLREHGLPWTVIAERLGVGVSTLRRWR